MKTQTKRDWKQRVYTYTYIQGDKLIMERRRVDNLHPETGANYMYCIVIGRLTIDRKEERGTAVQERDLRHCKANNP